MNQEYAAITPKWFKKHLENIKFKKLWKASNFSTDQY